MHTYLIAPRAARLAVGKRVPMIAALLAGAAVLALAAGPALAVDLKPAATAPHQDTTFAGSSVKSRLGRIARSSPGLLNRTDATPVTIVVKLDYDAVASYEGNIPGYAATSPKKTGKKLKDNKAAVSAYQGYAAGYEAKVLTRVKGKVASARTSQSFQTVYGGVP